MADAAQLAIAAIEAADLFDDTRNCTCDTDSGWCWYRLTYEEQQLEKLAFVTEAVRNA